MYLQHCLIVHLLWSTDIMRGNQGTSCLLGIPTPGPFCCLKLDFSVLVLVTGGDFLVPCVSCFLCISVLLIPAPDAIFIGSLRHPGSGRQPGSRRHIYLGSDTTQPQTPTIFRHRIYFRLLHMLRQFLRPKGLLRSGNFPFP